jgi:hypothetical protein
MKPILYRWIIPNESDQEKFRRDWELLTRHI